MQVDKEAVTEALRARGDHDRAVHADAALPRTVDTSREAALLRTFDVNVREVEAAVEKDRDSTAAVT